VTPPGPAGARPVLHLTGPVLTGPDTEVAQAWVVGGRVTFEPPTHLPSAGTDVVRVAGWVLPGLVDAHSHVGLDAHGAVDEPTQVAQATADRDAGALLLRDAGSPVDTHWIDDREDLPKIIRAGRHIARTGRYLRGFGEEIEPAELRTPSGGRRPAATAG
jgi:imidazolonepropionase-like amidohydrolase